MTHLFLSPHLDDVVLSCGGTLYELIQANEPVVVYTLMAGDAPNPLPFSDLIDRVHARWRLGKNPMPGRRAEEVIALGQYNLAAHFGEWQDAIHRETDDAVLLYRTDDDLFGPIHPDDPLLNATLDLRAWEPVNTLYIPLAAGNHVDHQIVRHHALKWLAAQTGVAVFFYEEYPYSSEKNEVYKSHAGTKARLSGTTAIDTAVNTLPAAVTDTVRPISEPALQTRLAAIQCYASQISTFWNSPAEMARSVTEYARQIGSIIDSPAGERYWTFV